MRRLPLIQIDAFADAPFTGNPAAVMPLDDWLPDEMLQAIAAENNVSATAFYMPAPDDADADFEVCWFTPGAEIQLCGHGTLATAHWILSREPDRPSVRFRTRGAGLLEVIRQGDGYALALPACPPSPRPLPEAVAALGAEPLETHFHESRYSLYLYETAKEVLALDPDFPALAALGNWQFVATAPGVDTDVLSRVFVPGGGIDEDPATGSAHAMLTPFWAARLGRDSFTAFQASRRGGRIDCRLDGGRAILGGRCVTVLEGTFLLP